MNRAGPSLDAFHFTSHSLAGNRKNFNSWFDVCLSRNLLHLIIPLSRSLESNWRIDCSFTAERINRWDSQVNSRHLQKSALLKWGDASVEDLFTDSGGSAVVVKRIQVLNICSPRLQNVFDGVQSRHGEASQRRDRQDQIRHGGVQDQVSYRIASFYSLHRKFTILLTTQSWCAGSRNVQDGDLGSVEVETEEG